MAERQARERGPDMITLIAGILTLLVAGYVLTDGAFTIPGVPQRWLLATAAGVIGLLLLLGSLRRRR